MASKEYWSEREQRWYVLDKHNRKRYTSERRGSNPVTPAIASSSSPRSRHSRIDSANTDQLRTISTSSPSSSRRERDEQDIVTGLRGISIQGVQSASEQSPFQVQPDGFFRKGRIFAQLSSESEPQATRSGHTVVSQVDIPASQHGSSFRGGIQRYVVMNDSVPTDDKYCYALRISTYGNQGVARHGIVKANHGVIYTSRKEPIPEPNEEPARGEPGMCAVALRAETRLPDEKLDPMSRIDYGTVFSIWKGCNVYYFGQVHDDSIPWLQYQYEQVQIRLNGSRRAQASSSAGPPSVRSRADAATTSVRKRAPETGRYVQGDEESEESENNDDNNDDDDDNDDEEQTRINILRQRYATECQQAQSAYQRMRQNGQTHVNAVQAIAQTLRSEYPAMTRESALEAAEKRLRAGSR